MSRILFLFYVAQLFQLQTVSHAQTAQLQSKRLFTGDIAVLKIEYDNRIPSLYALDTSVLEADFEVLHINSSVSRMFESNKAFHRMRWQIELLPRGPGKLRIPPLQIGEVFTPSLMLEVFPQSAELNSVNYVQVELQAEPERPYVGQQTQIEIRVVHNIPLSNGDLIEPSVDNADIYSHGQESRYSVSRHGREFQVLQRNLSIVARSPGNITISPANYRGVIQSATDASTAASRRINRASEALSLEAREPPAEFSGPTWLPARELKLDQKWDKTDNQLHPGDSLGLTLGIEAKGVPAEALPADLLSSDSENVRVYADQERRSNRFDGRELVGRLEQRFVVVVTKPGEIQLPAINLKWWDVEQEVERTARLEGKTLNVSAPENGKAGTDTAEPTSAWLGTDPTGLVITLARSHYWPWYLGGGAVLLISGLLLSIIPVRVRIRKSIAAMLASRRNRQLLKQACISNNPVLAFRELITWGRARWPRDSINGLYQIGIRAGSSELDRELRRLDRALYADRDETWQGQPLWRLLAAEHRHSIKKAGKREVSLPQLYPQGPSSGQ